MIKSSDQFDSLDSFAIKEVYYEDSKIVSWTDNTGSSPFGESVEELATDLKMMSEALLKPVLEEVDGKLIEVK